MEPPFTLLSFASSGEVGSPHFTQSPKFPDYRSSCSLSGLYVDRFPHPNSLSVLPTKSNVCAESSVSPCTLTLALRSSLRLQGSLMLLKVCGSWDVHLVIHITDDSPILAIFIIVNAFLFKIYFHVNLQYGEIQRRKQK